jgi:multiple sugar transport system substrate-binding protein
VYNSELYDFPAFPNTGAAAALPGWLRSDPFGSKPANKLALLATSQQWTTNVGYPGAANAAEGEIFNTNILPTMMANAAQGKATPKQAVASAASQCEAIYSKWRAKGLV